MGCCKGSQVLVLKLIVWVNVVGNLRFDWWNGRGAIDFQLEDFVQTQCIESLRVETILQSVSGLQDLAKHFN